MNSQTQVDSTDDALELVADSERRLLLEYLRRTEDGSVSFDTLVRRGVMSEWSSDDDPDIDEDRLRIRLHHVHVPKLQDAGVVEYDRRNLTIQYRPNQRLEALLDSIATIYEEEQ